MKKDRGHIKDFYLYILGLRKFNPKKPYDQQGKMRKRPGVKIPTFDELFPAPDYSALREDAFTLRKEQYLARIQKLPGPDRRRLLNGLALIEGYTLVKNPPEDPES